MSSSGQLASLSDTDFAAQLVSVVEGTQWSLAVVLVTGDIVIGDFVPTRVPVRDVASKPFAYYPKRWPRPKSELEAALWLRELPLQYPSSGDTAGIPICRLEPRHVAALWPLGWNLTTGVSALQGPLAEAVFLSNEAAARTAGIRTFRMVAASLRVPKRVEAEGITFENNELLYLDHAYFTRLSQVTYSAGVLGVGATVSVSLMSVVESVLANTLAKGVMLPSNTVRKVGTVVEVHPRENIEMEGEDWRLMTFRGMQAEDVPVLFKPSSIVYPENLWRFILSPVTVVGEDRQIPVQLGDREWRHAITARAMGHTR